MEGKPLSHARNLRSLSGKRSAGSRSKVWGINRPFYSSAHSVSLIYTQSVLPTVLSHRSRASPLLSVTFCLEQLFPFAFKNVLTSAIPSSPSPALFLTADEPIRPLIKHPGHALWPSSPCRLPAISATLTGQQVPEIHLSLPPNTGVTGLCK